MLQLSKMATVGARYVYMCVLGGVGVLQEMKELCLSDNEKQNKALLLASLEMQYLPIIRCHK